MVYTEFIDFINKIYYLDQLIKLSWIYYLDQLIKLSMNLFDIKTITVLVNKTLVFAFCILSYRSLNLEYDENNVKRVINVDHVR